MPYGICEQSRPTASAGITISAPNFCAWTKGHAVQVAGKNYLVPIDADLQSAADLDFGTIEVGKIISGMEGDSRVSLVLLDACRDNPFTRSLQRSLGTRSAAVGQGLAPIPVAPASGASRSTSNSCSSKLFARASN